MNFLTGLHGTTAGILICILLYVDEAGIPLPFAPNEVLLLLTGVLIASGAFPVWIIFPIVYLFMASGMVTGYLWARTLGQPGIENLAARVGATALYVRARDRMQSSGHWGIAAARLLPGVRPYATLICGAVEVDIRTFLLGALPALLLWEIVVIAAGVAVGLPVALLFSHFERFIVRAAILILLGFVAWLAVRNRDADRRNGIAGIAPRLRATFALLIDAGILLSVSAGGFSIVTRAAHIKVDNWVPLLVAAVMLIGLLVAGRSIQTPGERLFDTNYWHHHPVVPGS